MIYEQNSDRFARLLQHAAAEVRRDAGYRTAHASFEAAYFVRPNQSDAGFVRKFGLMLGAVVCGAGLLGLASQKVADMIDPAPPPALEQVHHAPNKNIYP